MAAQARLAPLTDELIAAVTGIEDKTSSEFRKHAWTVGKVLRESVLGRVNQHEVYRRIEGLEEKLRVLCNDELADALAQRKQELDGRREQWIPDILYLLLELSDRPDLNTDLEKVEALNAPPEPSKALTWDSIYATEPPDEEEKSLWQNVNYAESSSSDEVMSITSDRDAQDVAFETEATSVEKYELPQTFWKSAENTNLVEELQTSLAPYEGELSINEVTGEQGHAVSEVQTAREALFMLRGLSSNTFTYKNHGIEVQTKMHLPHASKAALADLLKSMASIGIRLNVLRKFIDSVQQVPFMQTMQHEMEKPLSDFDMFLSRTEARYASQGSDTVVSLIEVYNLVQQRAHLLLDFAHLLVKTAEATDGGEHYALDLLYDLACSKQASGEDEKFQEIARIFFRCFEVYFRPMRLWIEAGELDKNLGAFFVKESDEASDLRNLWIGWFELEKSSGKVNAPRFLQSASSKIFTTGKGIVLLKNLGSTPSASFPRDDKLFDGPLNPLLPFAAVVESAFGQAIHANHAMVSSLLRDQLGGKCGLWSTLDALEYVYLAKDVSLSAYLDKKVFDGIDQRLRSWNDRYSLTELVHQTFGSLTCIDMDRLVVRCKELPRRSFNKYCRSVHVLRAVALDYVLPWPVANIVTKESMLKYRRLATFLMQIRRAKYLLGRQRVDETLSIFDDEHERRDDVLGYTIRFHLLWFLNMLYSHVAAIIQPETARMRETLFKAKDVDAMIAVHSNYVNSIMEQCFLSVETDTIHQAILRLLDLCIRVADLQNMRHNNNVYEQGYMKELAVRRTAKYAGSQEDDLDSDMDEDERNDRLEESGHEGSSSFELDSVTYKRNVLIAHRKFHELCAEVTSRIKALQDLNIHSSWTLLAEKLDWRQSREF